MINYCGRQKGVGACLSVRFNQACGALGGLLDDALRLAGAAFKVEKAGTPVWGVGLTIDAQRCTMYKVGRLRFTKKETTMPRLSSAQIAEKHARNTANAVQDMVAGVQAVTASPMEAAAAALPKAAQNYAEAVNSGRMARRLRSVTLESWKDAMINKGAQRVASGVNASKGKVTAFWDEFGPVLDQVTSQVRQMPSVTLQDSIQRMVAQVEGVAKFKRGGRGGR